MADIFVSYAREDVARARLLAETLSAEGGWSIFWDRRIPHGQDFVEYIQSQLDNARCIVVLWSKLSVASQFVRDEAAEGQNGRLVPVLIEPVRPPLGFRQLQRADLTDWTGQPAHDEFDRLVESIRGIVPSNLATVAKTAGPAVTATDQDLWSDPYFTTDVYISAVAADNLELVEGQRGWVGNLTRALQIRLAQRMGRDCRIWSPQNLAGGDTFSDASRDALQHSVTLVSIVSPRSVKSEWMRRELAEFMTASTRRHGVTVRGRSRIFKVVKSPVALTDQPSELQSVLGYEFFRTDATTGRVRELDQIFGPEAHRDFWIKLDDLSSDIAEL